MPINRINEQLIDSNRSEYRLKIAEQNECIVYCHLEVLNKKKTINEIVAEQKNVFYLDSECIVNFLYTIK